MNRKNVIIERQNVETVTENCTSHVQVNLHLRILIIPQEKNNRKHISSKRTLMKSIKLVWEFNSQVKSPNK